MMGGITCYLEPGGMASVETLFILLSKTLVFFRLSPCEFLEPAMIIYMIFI